MSEFGVRDDGTFRKKPIDVIRADLTDSFTSELGSDIELRENSPVQKIIDAAATEIATQWDAAEAAFYASFYEDSFGQQLDKQLALAGFNRRPLRGATGEVVFSRDDPSSTDRTIPEGTRVTTERTDTRPSIPFQTTQEVILATGETEILAPIEAVPIWDADIDEQWLGSETNVNANAVTVIPEPISGIQAVTNPKPTGEIEEGFVRGRDRESDALFKLRYETARAEGGVSTVSAMQSSIRQFSDDIISARVEEVHDLEEGYGPEPYVFGPDALYDDIAQAVFESRAAGLESFGDESGEAIDDDSEIRVERFNRAEEVHVYIDLSLTISETYDDVGGEASIQDRIIRFIGGVDHDGDMYPGLEIGADVYFDQVFRRVMEERGVVFGDMEMGTDPDELSEDNIPITILQAAMTSIEAISVEVTDLDG